MSERKGVSVECRHEIGKSQAFRTGARSLSEIRFDFAGLSREEINGEHLGARLLLCAALACYTNTFVNALKAAGVEAGSMSARAGIEKERDDILRTRYTRILLELEVGVDEKDEAAFQRVREDMERGSLLTYSLDEGIEMEYDVHRV
jgi:uncharacterized OsmC-like protein